MTFTKQKIKIPDPIYDEYYFSSKENQEKLLRVVETLLEHQLFKFKMELKEQIKPTESWKKVIDTYHNNSQKFCGVCGFNPQQLADIINSLKLN